MAVNGNFNDCINSFFDEVQTTVEDILQNSDRDYLMEIPDDSLFNNGNIQFKNLLDDIDLDYKLSPDDNATDQVKSQIENHNTNIANKCKEFVVTSTFLNVINSRVQVFVESDMAEEAKFFNAIALILDFEVSLFLNVDPIFKQVYYDSILKITKQLFLISTAVIEKFWSYLETRVPIILKKLYQNTPSERMSLLEMCNHLTDNLIVKNKEGQRDSYKKDSFNDRFQARVRFFITSILNFEDNTGLNKYFHVSDRASSSIQTKDPYLEDLLEIQRLFNNPLQYLKRENQKKLRVLVGKVEKVSKELLIQENIFRSSHPSWDQFLILPPKSEAEKDYLTEKFSKSSYIPENYFISLFQENDRKQQAEDAQMLNEIMRKPVARMQCIQLIYVVAHFFSELSVKNKNQFLSSIHAPPNIKHFVDGVLPDDIVSSFGNVKKDIMHTLRATDPHWLFLLQHLTISEKNWWSWLTYGKNSKTNKSFFFDKNLTSDDIHNTEDTFKSIYPYKDKKYFNTFVTPQVTRKMKIQRGLSQIERADVFSINDSKFEIDTIDNELSQTTDVNNRNELLEKKSLLTWRVLRDQRSSDWLKATQALRAKAVSDQERNADNETKEDHSENIAKSQKRTLAESVDDDSPEEKKIRLDEQINSENSDDVSEKDPQNHVISEANDASADSDGENHDAVDVDIK